MNVVILEGRIVRDLELKMTQTGIPLVSICIAVKRDYPTSAEAVSDFIDVIVWRKTAEFVAKYFKKGDGIAVRGEIQTRTYPDADGNNRKVVEVVADKVEFPIARAKDKTQETALNNAEGIGNPSPKTAGIGVFEAAGDDEDTPF